MRAPRLAAGLVAVAALAACSSAGPTSVSSDGGSAVTLAPASSGTAGAAAPATLPSKVEPATAALVLGAELHRFAITGCSLSPSVGTDGITTALEVTGDDGQGGALDIVRRSTPAGPSALVTTTETVSYSANGTLVAAQRFTTNDVVHDLRDPSATAVLLAVDGRTLRATGLFGPPSAVAGSPGLLPGRLLAVCPDGPG